MWIKRTLTLTVWLLLGCSMQAGVNHQVRPEADRIGLTAEGKDKTLVLAQDGKTDYVIAQSVNASPSEQYAATELQKFLKEISGAEFPVITDDKPLQPCEIILGQNKHLAKLLNSCEMGNESSKSVPDFIGTRSGATKQSDEVVASVSEAIPLDCHGLRPRNALAGGLPRSLRSLAMTKKGLRHSLNKRGFRGVSVRG